ncbi:hypothetical protein J4E91_007712 [Alternaria rosae]|nr:hypothetical protein J4E91_007712 [Alternaria rosae]
MPSTPSTPPTITATALMNASSHDIAMLHDIHSLLNKIFTRNRNQHQRSTWWKSLHGFRRQIGLLLQDLEKCPVKEREAVYEEIASGDIQGVLSASDELAMAGEFGTVLDEEEEWDEGVVVARDEEEDDE